MSVARIIVLDAGPVGLASKPRGKPDADGCRAWIQTLSAAGARIIVPEIADYEIRRELLRVGATAGIRRLDALSAVLEYAPITTDAMRLAARYWAQVRRAGLTTADPHALDADALLAAQAALLAPPGDTVTVATTNVGHLARFVDAEDWRKIRP